MDKSIRLALSYVLKKLRFPPSLRSAFLFFFSVGVGGTKFGRRAKGEKGTPDTFTFFSPLASQENRKKKRLITGKFLSSMYFKFYLKFSVGSLRHLFKSLNRSFFPRIRGAVYGLTH